MKKLPKNWLLWIIGALFVMSMMPGEGTKASDQQTIVASKYTCTTKDDCPSCVLGGIVEYQEINTTFFGELSYAECVGGVCELSDACIIWDCPPTADPECKSVKQTILDNTIGKVNENPKLFFIGALFIVAFFML